MLPGQRLLSARARHPAASQRRGRRGTDAEGQAGRAAGGAALPAPPGCTVRSTHGAEEEEEEEGEREGSRRRKAGKPALRGTAANFPPAAGAASRPLVCIPPAGRRGGRGAGGCAAKSSLSLISSSSLGLPPS